MQSAAYLCFELAEGLTDGEVVLVHCVPLCVKPNSLLRSVASRGVTREDCNACIPAIQSTSLEHFAYRFQTVS